MARSLFSVIAVSEALNRGPPLAISLHRGSSKWGARTKVSPYVSWSPYRKGSPHGWFFIRELRIGEPSHGAFYKRFRFK